MSCLIQFILNLNNSIKNKLVFDTIVDAVKKVEDFCINHFTGSSLLEDTETLANAAVIMAAAHAGAAMAAINANDKIAEVANARAIMTADREALAHAGAAAHRAIFDSKDKSIASKIRYKNVTLVNATKAQIDAAAKASGKDAAQIQQAAQAAEHMAEIAHKAAATHQLDVILTVAVITAIAGASGADAAQEALDKIIKKKHATAKPRVRTASEHGQTPQFNKLMQNHRFNPLPSHN